MRLIFIFLSCFLFFPLNASAVKSGDFFVPSDDFKTTAEILADAHSETPTNCASEIFSNALNDNSSNVSESDAEYVVQAWAKNSMLTADVLERVLKCPEIASVSDETIINFTPIEYQFPLGRIITINYSTTPKILKQHLLLATKPSLPNGDFSPKLMDPNDPAKYLNTEPSWYGILVVEHDSLSEFVGPDKNNTVSLKYIDDNIDAIYPHGNSCTSKSAITLGNNYDTINKVVHEVVNIEDDSNDYYVAGDVDLGWVMYAEIAADVIITVLTWGGGALATGATKSARAAKTGSRLAKNIGKLRKFSHTKEYANAANKIARTTGRIEKFEKNAKNAKKYEKAIENLNKARKSGNAKDIAKYEKEAKEIFENAKKIDPEITENLLKNSDDFSKELANLRKELPEMQKSLDDMLKNNKKLLQENKELLNQARKNADPKKLAEYEKQMDELDKLYDLKKDERFLKKPSEIEKNNKIKQQISEIEKSLDDIENSGALGDYPKLRREVDNLESVEKYIKNSDELNAILKYRNELRAIRRPQTGNIITRTLKSFRAINNGSKEMTKAGRIARRGMSSRSARIGDWLKDATLKHGARLAKFEQKVGLLYGIVAFICDMYDYTSATSKEFSNGIEFKPLCLLSADDLEGQENVVNYGMWLMWVGNSTDTADDDAAYLQAMDFASKFYYQLDEYQDEHGANCNVDIYVVHPIIRLDETNIDDPHGEMFYLFMNETPWTTANQFGAR